MTKRWEIVPTTDFSEQAHWRSNGGRRWSALRVRLLVVCTDGKESRLGPVVIEHDVSPGDTIKLRVKRERVVTKTESVSQALRAASKARIIESLSARVESELAAKAPGFSGKINAQTSVHSEQELTHEVERTLNSASSHTVEDLEGQEHEIEFKGETEERRAKLRRLYRPKHWHVYLHSYDFLELSYHRTWRWQKMRTTMKRVDGQRLGSPLFSLTFYEPQADLVVGYKPVLDELENPEDFEFAPLTIPMPAAHAPVLQDLEDAAKLAFPASRAERSAAKQRRTEAPIHKKKASAPKKRKGKAAKHSAKRAAKKKSAYKKKSAKRVAKRKR